jgi:glucose-6-phosphate 1-dehydrogenase
MRADFDHFSTSAGAPKDAAAMDYRYDEQPTIQAQAGGETLPHDAMTGGDSVFAWGKAPGTAWRIPRHVLEAWMPQGAGFAYCDWSAPGPEMADETSAIDASPPVSRVRARSRPTPITPSRRLADP